MMQLNAPAIRFGQGGVVTYSDMAIRTNSIATVMLAADIKGGSRIAVLQEPSAEWICSLLAVMRVGAVYLPLDLSTVLTRLAVIVSDCQPSMILVDDKTEQHVSELRAHNLKTINVSNIALGKFAVPISAAATGIAMILYTSGSSGVPKGIMLKHESLLNWIEPSAQLYYLGSEVVLQQSSSSFDMSFTQIFTALCFGGSVYVLERCLRADAIAITEIIASEGITFTCATPSEYFSWIKYGRKTLLKESHWKCALCAGDPVVDTLLRHFAALEKSDLRFFNSYGPTEISLVATAMELSYTSINAEPDNLIAAGYVLPNYSVYVLDEDMRSVAPEVQGEIYIGGAGVALGYLNNGSLTEEKFVTDIFATPEMKSKGWNTMHRTGDLGRWQPDGSLLIEGRISGDTQIKLRGLRIDLRDIESTMIETANGVLSEAVVSVRRTSLENPEFLAAHVVFDPRYSEPEREQCLASLLSSLPLPQYMCPAVIVPLDHMLMTSSSKRDRRAIALLPLPETAQEQSRPGLLTAEESQLMKLWEEVISTEVTSLHKISRSTDFFHIGGTSLLLLSLQSKLRHTYGFTIPLVQMFESSTLGAMTLRLENSRDTDTNSFDWEEETRLSPATVQLQVKDYCVPHGPKVVILTGSTGYVGQALVNALVADPDIEKIYCIAVRHPGTRPLFPGLEKVIIFEGDLVLPRLGLSKDDAKRIFQEADRIIHNGADTSHMKTFQSLRLANLQSTKELIEMSIPRQIPVHYISTAGVGTYSGRDVFEEVSASADPPPADGFDGYTASKWTSERYLEKVNQHCGWPVWIHRPSSVRRRDVPELDLMQNILWYSRFMQAVPVSPNLRGVLDLVSLDTVVHSTMQELHSYSTGQVRFVHHAGDVELPLDDIKAFLDGESGGNAVELPIDEWARRAGSQGLHQLLIGFFANVINLRIVTFPKVVKGSSRQS